MRRNRHAPGRPFGPMVHLGPVNPAPRPAAGPATPSTPRPAPRVPPRAPGPAPPLPGQAYQRSVAATSASMSAVVRARTIAPSAPASCHRAHVSPGAETHGDSEMA